MTVQWFSRAVVVIAILMLTACNWASEARAQGADELASLRTQVSQFYSQGKYAEAAPIAERHVTLARQKHGDDHTEYPTAIAWLAYVYQAQGHSSEEQSGPTERMVVPASPPAERLDLDVAFGQPQGTASCSAA